MLNRLTIGLFWVPLAITTALGVTVFLLADFPWGVAVVIGLAVLWGFSLWRQRGWLTDTCLLLFICLMAAAVAFRLEFWLPLVAGGAAILTWDLASFLQRYERQPQRAEVLHHLRYVGLVSIISIGLIGIAQLVIIQLSFWAIVGVVAVLMTTLGLVISRTQAFARKQQDN